jgi:hypothetical protein
MQQQQQRSFSNPSQYSWNSALKDIQSAQRMDEVFSKVCSVSKVALSWPLCRLCAGHMHISLLLLDLFTLLLYYNVTDLTAPDVTGKGCN